MPPFSNWRKANQSELLDNILETYRQQTGKITPDKADIEDPDFVENLRIAVETDTGIDIDRQDFRKLLRKLLSER